MKKTLLNLDLIVPESLRILITTIASQKWSLKSIDIKGAYLQRLPISRELSIQPPSGFSEISYGDWKTPYDLIDAGRKWYIKVKTEFLK